MATEESQSWVTYAIIVLIVVIVIAIIIWKFYPETWNDIEKVAKEVFNIGEEQRKAELTEEVVGSTIEDITSCFANAIQSCGCKFEADKLPPGYKLVAVNREYNEKGSIIVQGFAPTLAPVGNGRAIENAKIKIAQPKEIKFKDKIIRGIGCQAADFTLTNEGGKIAVRFDQANTPVGPYNFYEPEIVQQVYRDGESICLITNAIEKEYATSNVNEGDSLEAYLSALGINMITSFSGSQQEWENDNQRKQRILQDIAKLPFCKAAEGTGAGAYDVEWPVAISGIKAVEDCSDANLEAGRGSYMATGAPGDMQLVGSQEEARGSIAAGTKIHLAVTEGTDVKVPVQSGIITGFCDEGCGEEGKSITIRETKGKGSKLPTGRLIDIYGLKEIKQGYKAKGTAVGGPLGDEIKNGKEVSGGEIIGVSTAKLIFSEMFERPAQWPFYSGMRDNTAQGFINARFCSLPRLSSETYSGTGCNKVVDEFLMGCSTGTERGTLDELMKKVSVLKEGERGSTMVNFVFGTAHYGYLAAFTKDRRAIGTRVWWNCPGTGQVYDRLYAPSNCGPDGCLCLCSTVNGCGGFCIDFIPNGFVPKDTDNPECDQTGVLIHNGGSIFRQISYIRVGTNLKMCTSAVCT